MMVDKSKGNSHQMAITMTRTMDFSLIYLVTSLSTLTKDGTTSTLKANAYLVRKQSMGKVFFFHPYHGFQIKGDFAHYSEGSFGGDFYDGETGEKVTHKGFVKRNSGDWFYLDDNGNRLMGLQNIDGKLYYFIASGASKYIQYGKQVKGEIVDFVANSNIAPVYSMWNKFEITRRYYLMKTLVKLLKIATSTIVVLGTTSVKMVMPSAQNLVKLLLMVKWFTSTSLVNRPKVSLSKSTVSHTTTMLILEPVCQTPFSRLKARPTNSTLMVTENLSDN